AACVLPIELWPYFAFRRRAIAARYRTKYPDTPLVAEVLARVRGGAVTANDLGGARDGKSGWWSWSHAKNALELLYMRGELACVTRRRWQRVYDVPERAIPSALLAQNLDDATCYRHLVGIAARALGVGTARDIGDYFMLCTPYAGGMPGGRKMVDRAIEEIGLVPVRVEGWDDPAFAHPDALADETRTGSRTTLLSPFDSLIWAPRQRMERLFGMAMKLEAYTPKHQRVHGYFSMPVLADNRLVGRVDPAREDGALVARYVSIEEADAVPPIAAALREAASWVAATDIRIERVVPKKLAPELKRALSNSVAPHGGSRSSTKSRTRRAGSAS
ncbi:MAG TPA: crosslink repair DNA glycosylase YcaQ family protein, partial [Dehalococcoidia bacterium]